MEEILASIRRIISEDGEEATKPAEAAKPKPVPPAVRAAPKPAPEPVQEDEDVLELTDMVEEEPEPLPPPRAPVVEDDDVVMVERSPMKSAPRAEARPPMVSRPRYNTDAEQGLISEEVRSQASSSLSQLSRDALVSESADPRSLEVLVQDMLRPALESWLNAHLPDIVERLVQQEIDRVSRRGR